MPDSLLHINKMIANPQNEVSHKKERKKNRHISKRTKTPISIYAFLDSFPINLIRLKLWCYFSKLTKKKQLNFDF